MSLCRVYLCSSCICIWLINCKPLYRTDSNVSMLWNANNIDIIVSDSCSIQSEPMMSSVVFWTRLAFVLLSLIGYKATEDWTNDFAVEVDDDRDTALTIAQEHGFRIEREVSVSKMPQKVLLFKIKVLFNKNVITLSSGGKFEDIAIDYILCKFACLSSSISEKTICQINLKVSYKIELIHGSVLVKDNPDQN